MKNKKKLSGFLISLALIIFVVLSVLWKVGPRIGVFILPPSPGDYGRFVISKLDQGLYTNKEEWDLKRKELLEKFSGSQTYDEIDAYVAKYITFSGGENSKLITRIDRELSRVSYTAPGIRLKDDILYIKLPTLNGTQSQEREYYRVISEAIGKNNYKGIIIDLRGNERGSLDVFLAPFTPVLPEGEIFKFVLGKEDVRPVKVSKGVVSYMGKSTNNGLKNLKNFVPVAIIQDNKTKGASEQLIIAFEGLYNVRSFGGPTAGFMGFQENTTLISGNIISLTIGKIKDRTDYVYEEKPLMPDVSIDDVKVIEEAEKWLRQMINNSEGN